MPRPTATCSNWSRAPIANRSRCARAVTLRSKAGPDQTIFDGNGVDRPLTGGLQLAGRTLRIEGIKFRFGFGDPGGAIWFVRGTLECVDCEFDRCTSPDRAGAVTIQASSSGDVTGARFENCVFRECDSAGRGGAVFPDGRIRDRAGSRRCSCACRFDHNAGNQGGAVFASAGAGSATVDVDFEHCIFADNFGKDGGALLAESGSGESLRRSRAPRLPARAERGDRGGERRAGSCERGRLRDRGDDRAVHDRRQRRAEPERVPGGGFRSREARRAEASGCCF